MSAILLAAAVFLISICSYLRAYRSQDEKYLRTVGSPHLKPSSIFATSTHTVLFGLPPASGAVTAFLAYEHFGGEVNGVSIFLLLLTLILGPYLLIKAFNKHRQVHQKSSKINPETDTAVNAIFTRPPLSPKKYRENIIMVIIQFSLLLLIVVGVFVMDAVKRSNIHKYENDFKTSLLQDLSPINVSASELKTTTTKCRGDTFIYTQGYVADHCTTYAETTTKRFSLQTTKETLLQNSWQLTKEEDFGKQNNTWGKRADFRKSGSCVSLIETDGPETTEISASLGPACKDQRH